MDLKTARCEVFKASQNYLRQQMKLEDVLKDLDLCGIAHAYGKGEIARHLLRLEKADDILIEACRVFVETADKLTEGKK